MEMYGMCEQRPSLIVFQTIQKLVFFKLANKIFFRGKRPLKPSAFGLKNGYLAPLKTAKNGQS